jgi:uncharacterized protein YqeY
MSLKDNLQEDWVLALKSKDRFKANVISMAKAAILHAEKVDGSTLDDEAIITIIAREVKQRKEAIVEFEKGNRQDLVDQNTKEIEILFEYLPKQLTSEEIVEIIKNAVIETGATSAKDMGKVMSAIKLKVKGRADGKLVSDLVKQILS